MTHPTHAQDVYLTAFLRLVCLESLCRTASQVRSQFQEKKSSTHLGLFSLLIVFNAGSLP